MKPIQENERGFRRSEKAFALDRRRTVEDEDERQSGAGGPAFVRASSPR